MSDVKQALIKELSELVESCDPHCGEVISAEQVTEVVRRHLYAKVVVDLDDIINVLGAADMAPSYSLGSHTVESIKKVRSQS